MLRVEVETYEDINEYLQEEKEIFFTAIIDSIEKAWQEKLDVVLVAEFFVNGDETVLSIEMSDEDWKESLHLALYHFEEIEDYEYCIRINKLMDEIYG